MLHFLKAIAQNPVYSFIFVFILFVVPVLAIWYVAKWWPQNKRFSKMLKDVEDIKSDVKYIRNCCEQSFNSN